MKNSLLQSYSESAVGHQVMRAGPRLIRIADTFGRYANFTLGGASITVAVLHRELLDKRQWLSADTFYRASHSRDLHRAPPYWRSAPPSAGGCAA